MAEPSLSELRAELSATYHVARVRRMVELGRQGPAGKLLEGCSSRGAVARSAVADAARELVAAEGWLLADTRAVVVNALFEETGRLLSDAENVPLLVHEVPMLNVFDLTVAED